MGILTVINEIMIRNNDVDKYIISSEIKWTLSICHSVFSSLASSLSPRAISITLKEPDKWKIHLNFPQRCVKGPSFQKMEKGIFIILLSKLLIRWN